MLYKSTVKPELLELLIAFMSNDNFSKFKLAGGTALALQIGHRISTDLDFFTTESFDNEKIIELLKHNNCQIVIFNNSERILQLLVNNIKVDFLFLSYPEINSTEEIEGLKLYSKEDIAAMKLNAITNRGAKKDFYDLYFLLNYFSMTQMISFFQTKFAQNDIFALYKSLTYFDIADNEPDPILFKKLSWTKVKKRIIDETYKIIY